MSSDTSSSTKLDVQDIIDNFNSYPTELWFSNSWKVFNLALGNNPYHYTVVSSSGEAIYDNRTPEQDLNKLPDYNTFAESIKAYNSISKNGVALIREIFREWAISLTMDNYIRLVHVETPLK